LSELGKTLSPLLSNSDQTQRASTVVSLTPLIDGTFDATRLAASLARALSLSGFFYESHLVEWIEGRRTLTDLRQEPQAAVPRHALRLLADTHAGTTKSGVTDGWANLIHGLAVVTGLSSEPAASVGADRAAGLGTEAHDAPPPSSTQARSVDLAQFVRLQLQTLDTQTIAWRGELLPGDPAEVTVRRDADAEGNELDALWHARLRLALPNLGEVEVALALRSSMLKLEVRASEQGQESLQQGAASFRAAVEAHGVTIGDLRFESALSRVGRTSHK
jgi:hypothetical protein